MVCGVAGGADCGLGGGNCNGGIICRGCGIPIDSGPVIDSGGIIGGIPGGRSIDRSGVFVSSRGNGSGCR